MALLSWHMSVACIIDLYTLLSTLVIKGSQGDERQKRIQKNPILLQQHESCNGATDLTKTTEKSTIQLVACPGVSFHVHSPMATIAHCV